VANHHSFSKAAQALDITQPAVSIQVQELEKSLGVTLFLRRSRGLRLTEVGETVFSYSQQIFALSDRLIEVLEETKGLNAGHLTLGASTTPGEYVLPLVVGQFRKVYPGIRLELVIANTTSIIQRILSGEMDLGMVGDLPKEHSDDLEMIVYVEDEIVLVAAPSHPLAQTGHISLKDVVKEGIIVREQGSATRRTAEREFEALGFSPSIALELGSNQAVKQAAAGGGGVGVISRLGVEAEVKAGMLTVLEVSGWDCHRPLTVIYAKDRYLSPAQIAFRQFLLDRRPGGALTPSPSP
jgi:DNA-binding transcriptional LysR family regulator